MRSLLVTLLHPSTHERLNDHFLRQRSRLMRLLMPVINELHVDRIRPTHSVTQAAHHRACFVPASAILPMLHGVRKNAEHAFLQVLT